MTSPPWATCAASASSSAPTSTCRSTARRSRTTAASGPRSRPSRASPRRAHASSCAPTSAGPKGAPEEQLLAGPGRRPARRAARPPGRPSPPTRWARAPRRRSRRMADGDVVLLENLRFNPGETAKTDEGRAEFADALAGLADAFVSDGFGVVHRKQASVYDVATRLPSAMGGLVAHRGRACSSASPSRPRAPVRRGARRRQGRRQARRHRQPDEHRRPPAHRRRHALHLPRGPGPRDRHEPVRRRQRRGRARATSSAPRRPASRSCCRSTSCAAGEFSADTETVTVAADAIPADLMGLDIGPKSAAAVRREARRHPHRLLERPDGRVRDGAVRRRHPPARARPSSRSPRRAP